MCDVAWTALEPRWDLARRSGDVAEGTARSLQHLKSNPAFRAVGSERTLEAIDAVLAGQHWRKPSDWGAIFIVFPSGRPWDVPGEGWHLDTDYLCPLRPPAGVKVHAMFGDVARRGDAHHQRLAPVRTSMVPEAPAPARCAGRRAACVAALPPVPPRSLHCRRSTRLANTFCDRVEDVDGVPLGVLENTATAVDVILMHPLLLHALPTTHVGARPRFLLNKDIYL
jgi:hypothetical protein